MWKIHKHKDTNDDHNDEPRVERYISALNDRIDQPESKPEERDKIMGESLVAMVVRRKVVVKMTMFNTFLIGMLILIIVMYLIQSTS